MQPRLSVVVPIYNVEEFLEECLESIARQTVNGMAGPGHGGPGGLECVMVDDGSTDGSPLIAREFAARDPRFVYVRQRNAGLSAARNTGVRKASPTAEFLTFVDSDDVVPHDAYERMIASLDETGSDFASGNVWRLTERGRSQAWQYKWLTEPRTRTHISRDLDLLSDRVAWNKVFRRAFWDRHRFTFPEGKLYEDTPVMIPAHFLAHSVDVLSDHVYYWRVREGSITRRRTDVKGVRDRIAACAHVSGFLARHAPEMKKTYDASCLRDDFVYFLEGLPMGGPEYRAAFMTDTAAFLRRADPSVIAGLPVDLRVKWHLVREGRTAELIDLLTFERANGTAFHVRGALRRRAAYPGIGRVPERLTRVGRDELPVVARAGEIRWGADGTLRISGYAYVRNLEATRPAHSVKAGLLRSTRSRGRFRRVPTRTVAAPQATEQSRQRLHCYDLAGFEMTVDPEQLRTGGAWQPGNWLLGVVVAGHGTVRRAAVRAADGPSAQSLVRELGDGLRLVVGYSKGRLVLRIKEYAARVEAHRRDGGDVVLSGSLPGRVRPRSLRLTHPHSGTDVDCPVALADDRFEVRVRLADLTGVAPTPHLAPKEVEPPHGERWQANLVLPDGTLKSLAASLALAPGRYASDDGRELCATANDRGELVVEVTRQPVADRVAWGADGTLTVEMLASEAAWPTAELVLRHSGRDEELTVPAERVGERLRAVVAPGGGALREGRWYAFLRDPNASPGQAGRADDGMPVRLLASVAAGLPLHQSVQGREFTLDRRFGDRLLVEAGSVLARTERGAYRQHRLRTAHYPRHRQQPLTDAVLYLDGDSPRAVHEELVRRGADVEHLWVTHDQQTRVPAGAKAVEEHSAAWYEALARCRRIVTAGHLPEFFERREGQTVVQTWNGAPLKRIGTDLTDSLYADHGHLDALPRLSRQWDVLVSPNRFSTPHLGRALAYEGEVLEAGSPRNDVLFGDDRQKVAERVRNELGVTPDKRVVLYAPTYRDHLAYAPGRFRYEPALDFRAAESVLGDDHVLLVRKHPLTAGRLPGARAPFVRDVTAHPRAAELLLIADVLVTDYSSLMFDFAHTGRPMLFHAYDLEHYRDTVRGFYLDFETSAPGPLLASTGEVVEALRDLDAIAARHTDAYSAFREAYCDLDDGRAAARVAERLMR
ncbi:MULTISPECIES: bifunctional glycosyltransferase/CDP-glycerol:glycerophosphate glycerophosphotransferase [Streptomyces]|uniref:bifunctional glycosyltransferase/CDP-glycerol:glycerophosphate glycerophosphotransferase n=1 Tax=Streptomyces TaxID=1883 RepID=UPI001E2B805F|nr:MULTISPECIES: CDP-glycerol glycerophosphotransferase family protein [Streptomyces]UFQ15978.1 CDP-glycerol glycerophosphotransferase family protein [Streptomyces huasconensis]WCL85582.1 CDP-glycerol glycerophosphotransferase family protein [Streptomyces sp. JCM 35825]